MTLTTEQIIERASQPGGALHDIVQEEQAKHATEQAEIEKQQKASARAATKALTEAREAFQVERDARFDLQLAYVERQESYEAAQIAYAAAQRAARSQQIFEASDEVCLDKLTESLSGTHGSWEARQAMTKIKSALRSGV